jgi:NADPH2:quinone reductase
MRAMRYTAAGDAGVIAMDHCATPEPGPRQIRVRVVASALNRADILQRRGRYPAPPGWPADIPGLEYAGEVDSLGEGVTRWRRGDGVMGLVGGGGHAEFVVVHEDEAIAIPSGMAWTSAAAIPEAFLTAWDGLLLRGRLQPAERVLIHAVGSGVGTAAVQLAKWAGAATVGTSRQAGKLARARALGLDEAICTADEGWHSDRCAAVDVILDVLGGAALQANLGALRQGGRLIVLGLLQGPRAELPLELLMRQRLTIEGSVMRSRHLAERVALARRFEAEVLGAFAGTQPALQAVVGAVYAMAELPRAHAAMEADDSFGKLVLQW